MHAELLASGLSDGEDAVGMLRRTRVRPDKTTGPDAGWIATDLPGPCRAPL